MGLAENISHSSQKSPSESTEIMEPGAHQGYAYNFPFPPYDIQVSLMSRAYEAFEKSRFALLESPTGTGKSLSIICSSLTWLRDHQKKTRNCLVEKREELSIKIEDLRKEEESSCDWLSAQTKRQEISRVLSEIDKQLELLNKFDERSHARHHAKVHGAPLENYISLQAHRQKDKTSDDILNESYEVNLIGDKTKASQESNKSEADQDQEDMDKKVAHQDEDQVKPKIYYASRTHSQLSQFVNEVKRTKFAKPDDTDEVPIKLVAIASRANLCVNQEVLRLRDPNAINERCMEMHKETKKEKRCPYIKAKQVNELKEDILSEVYDIEDLVGRGRSKGACPYYASRMAIPEAELVVLPYNNLLHRETREAASLDLKDNIVIVDEAHNILETICSIHSSAINGAQILGCHTIFSHYYKKYSSRMSPRNASIIKIIVQCLTALLRYLNSPAQHIKYYESPRSVSLDESVVVTSGSSKHETNEHGKLCKPAAKHEEFMFDVKKFTGASNVERFNVFKILDYMNRSQLARKLLGFYRQIDNLDLSLEIHEPAAIKSAQQSTVDESDLKSPKRKRKKTQKDAIPKDASSPSKVPVSQLWQFTSLGFLKKANPSPCKQEEMQLQAYPVYPMMEFFRALTNSTEDGKILTDYHEGNISKSSLKFLLLNPSSQFKQMVDEARSIVLAGGTMQPFDEFTELLFGPLGVDESRLSLFSCGHVISPDHLYMASLYNGPANKPIELSFRMRNSFETIDEIGRTIMNLSFVVPGGMVCFLPSYEYENICFTRWAQIGIISKIETRSKHVFREPRQASHLRPIFDEYSKMIEKGKKSGRGSLLFCVVGGKMSEGINFSDDLGRCVVMVGLPYANIKSGELREKMAYYDRTCKSSGDPKAGQKYYENLCMKGINQSIGRSIRHKNDYAAVILLDRRYQTKSSIKNGLPRWMSQSMKEHERFGPLFGQLKSFYDTAQLTLS